MDEITVFCPFFYVLYECPTALRGLWDNRHARGQPAEQLDVKIATVSKAAIELLEITMA